MDIGESFISERRETQDPTTGRKLIQLTAGECFDYPMYYYAPTATRDGKEIVFFRYEGKEVQHYKIQVETGRTTRLTNAATADCLWRPYLYDDHPTGVRDLMSACSPATNELVYWDRNRIHVLHIETLSDRVVCELPEDRVPCSMTGVGTDGKWFAFVHTDRPTWEKGLAEDMPGKDCVSEMAVVKLATGTLRSLLEVKHWITHCNFYDGEKILFSHAAREHAILMTDVEGGYYTHLRTMRDGISTCHYQATARGIVYEVITDRTFGIIGRCDPETRRCTEYEASRWVYHVAYDAEGKLWFYSDDRIRYFPELTPGVRNEALDLSGPLKTYSKGQRSHLHAALMPDRRHILFTGGDPTNETNHLFLLDTSDLCDTETVLF